MSHANKADKLLIKPAAGARPAPPHTRGQITPKAHIKRPVTRRVTHGTATTRLAMASNRPLPESHSPPNPRARFAFCLCLWPSVSAGHPDIAADVSEEARWGRQSLQLVKSAILEGQARSSGQYARRLRNQNLVRPRHGHDSRGLVYGHTTHSVADVLHLPNMEAGSDS